MKKLLVVLVLLWLGVGRVQAQIRYFPTAFTHLMMTNQNSAEFLAYVGAAASSGGSITNGTFSGGTFTGTTNTGGIFTGTLTGTNATLTTPQISNFTATGTNFINNATTGPGLRVNGSGSSYVKMLDIANGQAMGVETGSSIATNNYAFYFDVSSSTKFAIFGSGKTAIRDSLYIGGLTGFTYPQYALDVIGAARIASTSKLNFGGTSGNADASAFINNPSSNSLAFGIAGSEKARFDSAGKFGIGVTSPQYLMDLNGEARIIGTNGLNFGGTSGAADKTVTIHQSSANTLAVTATTTTVSGGLTIAGTTILTQSSPPASAAEAGTVGTIAWDANYIYICTSANTWKRVAIATW